MANCFGEAVDNYFLRGQHKYAGATRIGQQDRAAEAFDGITRDHIDQNATMYARNLKALQGNGQSTLCLLYNATGDSLHYVADCDWMGFIGRTPYPTEIKNGQWAAFHHVHNTGRATGSEAAVVYRGKNVDGQDRDYLVAWCTPWWFGSNKAYCEIGDVDSFQGRWGHVYDKLNSSHKHSSAEADGCKIDIDTAGGNSPVCKAKFHL